MQPHQLEKATSSRFFEFVFKMFSEGRACVPARGMQAIPQQLAARLPEGAVRLNTPVEALDGLQRDMLDALHDDQVKKQINDAKLRAVKQRVEYDEFEKLVAGAHLRPIKPRSQTLDEVSKSFDGFVLPKHDAAPAGPAPPPKAAAIAQDAVPPPAKTSRQS